MSAADVSRLGRRQILTSACAGALSGAAWAFGLRAALGEDDLPTVTVARSWSSTAALIDYQRHRVLLLSSSDADDSGNVIETISGFMRQRIDVLVVPAESMVAVSPVVTRRWAISTVIEVPAGGSGGGRTFSGRALTVGDLSISVDRQPLGAWRAGAPDVSPWFATVRFGASQIVIAGPGAPLDRLPIDADAATCLLVCDELDAVSESAIVDAVVAPAESGLHETQQDGSDMFTVPLHRDRPLVLRMSRSAIEFP